MGKLKISSIPVSFSFIFTVFSLLCFVLIEAQNIVPFPAGTTITSSTPTVIANEQIYTLQMSGAQPTRANQTICTGFTLPASPSEFWIIQYAGNVASTSGVHHMTLYGCDTTPAKPCGCALPNRSILYSWVRFTPPVRFTGFGTSSAGGFRIGGTSDKKYIFLEIHYHHTLSTADTSGVIIHTTTTNSNSVNRFYDLAIFSMMTLGTIPGNTAKYKLDNCGALPSAVFGTTAKLIGFQVHTHNLGRLVSGYYMASVTTSPVVDYMFGQANPLWPQAYITGWATRAPYIPVANDYGFWTRCVYQTTGVSNATNTIGPFPTPTNWLEMCHYNMLMVSVVNKASFSTTKNAFIKGTCTAEQSAILDAQSTSTTLLPTIPALDTYAYNGTGTGKVNYGSGQNAQNINLDSETFTAFFR